MSIEHYGNLPDSQAVYDIQEDLSPEDRRILYLASMTDAARRGMALSEDDTYEWLDKLAGDDVIVSRDEETGDVNGMIAHNKNETRDWVSYLAVTPTERGSGIGRALIEEVRRRAGNTPVTGEATPTSETYYEHLGLDVADDRTVTT